MLLHNQANIHSLSEQFGRKFTRREDLTSHTRLYIAYTALTAQLLGLWGTVTELSRQFLISRTFVYALAGTLNEAAPLLFGATKAHSRPLTNRELSYQVALSLRLEGRCSIDAISTIMKRFGLALSSTGTISQNLSLIGSLLPHTLKTETDEIQLVVFLSDEIFSKSVPILVTVEPASSAILKIELADSRKAEDWKKHFECLQDNGFVAIYLVSDEGRGLCAAQKEALQEVFRQPDTYHAIAHQLGLWKNRLEQAAYKAIAKEYECETQLDSSKTNQAIEKRWALYVQARKEAEEAINLYDNFCYLYSCIIRELQLFDSEGNLRDRYQAEENIKSGLDLIEALGHLKITEALCKIKRILPELLNYFEIAETLVSACKNLPIDNEALKALCLAWQWRKALLKAKQADRKKWAIEQEQFCLEIAEGLLQEDYEVIKEEIYLNLDQIVQSSALVECINSIIRPYLNNSKNHVTQEFLNLIMFYHNHRRYHDGKRKGQTPMEILTGMKQNKDWIELLFEKIKEKDPVFFMAS
jgi:hypothetical protein